MKNFWNWLTSATIREPRRYSARVAIQRNNKATDDYHEEASFGWLGQDPTDSSIFDSPRGCTAELKVQSSLEVQSSNDDDPGYDPYDTGRFEP